MCSRSDSLGSIVVCPSLMLPAQDQASRDTETELHQEKDMTKENHQKEDVTEENIKKNAREVAITGNESEEKENDELY